MKKFKKTLLNKKILSMILLVITLFSNFMPIVYGVNINTTENYIGTNYFTGFATLESNIKGIASRKLRNTATGEEFVVFCAEHGVDFKTGVVHIGNSYIPTSEKMKKACKVLYLGWYSKYGNTLVNDSITGTQVGRDYAFTQQLMWETLGQSNTVFISKPNEDVERNYQLFKANIENQMNTMATKPSFDNVIINAGDTIQVTDRNNVLLNYYSATYSENGITIKHNQNENFLTISVDNNVNFENYLFTEEKAYNCNLIKANTESKNTNVYIDFPNGVEDQMISMNYNDPVPMSINININRYGKLELKKLNTNGDLINGAKYRIFGPDNYTKDVLVENGRIILENLKIGTYTIKEIEAPQGYLIDTNSYNVEVKVNQTTTQAIIDKEPIGKILVCKENNNKDKIANAKFQLIADENITNKAKTITYYQKGDVIETTISNVNGVAQFDNLYLGKYYIKEIEAPQGYLLNSNIYKANLEYKDEKTPIVEIKIEGIINEEPVGKLKITKYDKETGNINRVDETIHHGDATIGGTEHTLYAKEDIYNVAKTIKYFSKDEKIATFIFNDYGIATINIANNNNTVNLSIEGEYLIGLPMGKYYSKETKVSMGYKLDTTIYDCEFKYANQEVNLITKEYSVINDVERAKFKVIKVSTNNNTTAKVIEGAEFTAILSKYVDYYGSFEEAKKHLNEFANDEYSIFKTGSDGHGISGLLAYGEYTVNETYTPSPEIETVEQFYVTIDRNSETPIKELIENDLPFESFIKIQKKDKKTGKFITYSNVTFELYKLNKETNEWKQVECKVGNKYIKNWSTDDKGIARTERKIESGHYKIKEIKIPTGFIQVENELIFDINNRNNTLEYDKDWDAWITVTVENEQPTGTLIVDKNIAIRENVDTSLVDISDLSGIEFTLKAKENIIDYADGSVIYEKGKIVKVFNLDKNGDYTLAELPMGIYELYETKTLDGLVLNTNKYEVKFEQKDLVTKVYEEKKDIKNDTTVFEFSKTDITVDEELKGATLTVTDKDGKIIDTWVSGEKTHKIEGLKVGETYTLKEEITPEGYVKATSIKFTIKNTGEIQKVTMIDKVVEMSKTDIAGNEVEGAELKVMDKDGNIVDSWTSSKESHKIKGLEEGKTYTLIEDYAPDGYVIANQVEFTVTLDKETQKIEMIDKIVEITKTDLVTGEELEGAELEVIDKETGETIDKWTSTKESHKVVGLEENKTYILRETTAPFGYEMTEEIEFIVTENKETQKIEMKDMPILKKVKIIKIDLETKEIIKNKFVFGIYEDKECTKLIKEIESNKKDGYVIFENLRYGIYYIKELQAPDNYEKSDKIIKVEINDKAIFVNDVEVEEKESTVTINFENKKIPTPKTGDNLNIKLVFIILMISFWSIIFIIINHYKNK